MNTTNVIPIGSQAANSNKTLRPAMSRRSNLHIYQSFIEYETRILKITQSLVQHGVFDDVVIVGKCRDGLVADVAVDQNRRIRRIGTRVPAEATSTLVRIVQTLEWMARTLVFAIRMRPACVNCHSLLVLPLGVLLRWMIGCQLVYDTHELETETSLSKGLRRWLVKKTERWLIRQADTVFVVGDAIADWYRQTYPGLTVHVVRNVPYAKSATPTRSNVFRQRFEIDDDQMIFLYQGLIDEGRGIDLLLEVFAQLPRSKHVVFLGYGARTEKVKQLAAQHANIHYHPAVPPEQLAHFSCGADVGLSIIENVSLSYAYCVPNKLFEYLHAGIPVIASDLPEMRRVMDAHGCGWKVAVEEQAIVELIDKLTFAEVAAKRDSALNCRHRFTWEREEECLLGVYGYQSALARCA